MNPRGMLLEPLSNVKVDLLGTVPQLSEAVAFGFQIVLSRDNTMDHNLRIWLILENSFGNVQNAGHDEVVVTFFDVQVVRTNYDIPELWTEFRLLDSIFPVPE